MAVALSSPAAISYALELDSTRCGFLNGFGGGDALGSVVLEAPDKDGVVHKHIGGVKYEDIAFRFGAGMPARVFAWIAAALEGTDAPKDGAIVGVDGRLQAMTRMEFSGALIREVAFPALDAGSNIAALVEVKLTPRATRYAQAQASDQTGATQGKPWLASNFRLQIDGLDCSKVKAIDALTFSRDSVPDQGSQPRKDQARHIPLSTPNLAFMIAETGADSLIAWHQDFIIKGNNRAGAEKNGTLQFLAPNLRDVLFALTLRNLGIFKLAREWVDSNNNGVQQLRAEMYCEQTIFQYPSATSA
jgi:hypothetical protein